MFRQIQIPVLLCMFFCTQASSLSAHEFLTGYKVTVLTRVYEDRSLSIKYELNLDPDAAETIAHKRGIFERNGYRMTEIKKENALILTAAKSYPTNGHQSEHSDELSRISVICRNDTFYYREVFHNYLIRDEIASSNLKKDTATAKVLMADTEYLFMVIMPGRVVESATGQAVRDTIQWQYDIEELFPAVSLNMSAASVIERDEDVSGVLILVSVLLFLLSGLMWYRNKIVRKKG